MPIPPRYESKSKAVHWYEIGVDVYDTPCVRAAEYCWITNIASEVTCRTCRKAMGSKRQAWRFG